MAHLAGQGAFMGVVVRPDHLIKLGRQRLRFGNGTGERHGTCHGRLTRFEGGAVRGGPSTFGQPVPAADNLHRVIEVDLVVLISQLRLQRPCDVLLVHSQDEHLVVGQQPVTDRLAEPETVKLRPVQVLIVHGTDQRGVLLRSRLGVLVIQPRRRRHVETLACTDVVVVVDLHKMGLIRPEQGHSSRAVRLITDDQIELGQTQPLRFSDHPDRLIRRIHNGDPIRCFDSSTVCQTLGISGGGERQVHQRDVLGIITGLTPAHLGVRAHRERPQFHTRRGTPLGQRLRQQ